MVILIDSGCTNNFLDESMWLALILPLSSKDTFEVQMVSGAILRTKGVSYGSHLRFKDKLLRWT